MEPTWWASLVFTLAKGRVTKDTEHWVLWELPLSRALLYHHCALRSAGQWTVRSTVHVEEALLRTSQALQEAMSADDEESYAEEDDFD